MTINIGVLNATGKLNAYTTILEKEIEVTLKKVSEYFELANLDITVTPFQKGEVSPSGIGGYALSSHRVELLIDCERDDVKSVIETELVAVLSHEIHHSIRMGLGVPSVTLSQELITEGLACHFEHTVTGGKPSSLFEELQDYDWQQSLAKMSSLLNGKDHCFNKFFLGTHSEEFPKYAGYWIGFNLVSQYIQRNKATDSDIVGLESEKFFDGLT